jgi:hypothetical protein
MAVYLHVCITKKIKHDEEEERTVHTVHTVHTVPILISNPTFTFDCVVKFDGGEIQWGNTTAVNAFSKL